MSDIHIRKIGRAGRITLARPKALNALSYDMVRQIDAALIDWAEDPQVALVVIDAEGDRAFCAGGDIQEMYDTGRAGDFSYGRRFWADEYRMNARIAHYPKPYVALIQGFDMGGGVGVSCHGSHRIVCETSQIAMPECAIGLVPDVGGSWLLARAPGRLGEYLGLTGTRMGPGDAIFAGFADTYVPREYWLDLIALLEETGDPNVITRLSQAAPEATLPGLRAEIDRHFAGTLAEIAASLEASGSDFAQTTLKALGRASPLSAGAALALIRQAREATDIAEALAGEYRFTWRAAEEGDFLEGIRAAIIDKDRNPHWRHASLSEVTEDEIAHMIAPLGENELDLQEK